MRRSFKLHIWHLSQITQKKNSIENCAHLHCQVNSHKQSRTEKNNQQLISWLSQNCVPNCERQPKYICVRMS